MEEPAERGGPGVTGIWHSGAIHQPLVLTHGPSPKAGWHPPPMHWFQNSQPRHKTRPIFNAPHRRDDRPAWGSSLLVKTRSQQRFYQIPLAQVDQEKTGVCMPWGKFHFTMMPFGLRNAPASFQRMMDTVLDDIQDFSGAYMDDIIIFSRPGKTMWHTSNVC